MNFLGWSDEQIEDLVNRVYGGVVSPTALPMDLYESILDRFDESILDGFGGIGNGIDSKNLFIEFGENIKKFSFAKTFQQISDMGNFILDGDGNQILFSEFKKKASEIFEIYNNNWLETEFNTAKSIAESVRQWVDIQANKDVLPYLRYSTVGDGRVRASHRELDGIIKRVDDPFWDIHYVPNDFNCRCIVEQIEEGEETDLTDTELEPINPLFRNNPAKTGEVFSVKDHPYFNGLGKMINVPIKDILPKPKPVPKPSKKYSFKTKVEAKAAIIRDIEANSPLKINKVTISSDLDVVAMGRRADTLKELFSEYNLSASRDAYKGTDIFFKSNKSYLGVVKSGYNRVTKKTFVAQANFGDRSKIKARLNPDKDVIDRLPFDPNIDEINGDIYVTTHEFAHVIATNTVKLYGDAKDLKFFKALEELRTEYVTEMRAIRDKYIADPAKILKEQYKISLGTYANTNINEFMAEGFSEYRLHSSPSKYAEKIGKLIDENYKK